jgi:hypothetical protein
MVAHTYNSSDWGGRNWEDHGFEASLGKKFRKIPITITKPSVVVYICHPNSVREEDYNLRLA